MWSTDLAAKALELFIQDIVETAVEQTRKTGGKRVAPYHLYVGTANLRKRAALMTETFDFLRDILEKVPDPLESATPRGTKRRKTTKAATEEDPVQVKVPKSEENAPTVPEDDEEEHVPVSKYDPVHDACVAVPEPDQEPEQEPEQEPKQEPKQNPSRNLSRSPNRNPSRSLSRSPNRNPNKNPNKNKNPSRKRRTSHNLYYRRHSTPRRSNPMGLPTRQSGAGGTLRELTNADKHLGAGQTGPPKSDFFFVSGASKNPCRPFLRFTTDCVGGGWRTTFVTRPLTTTFVACIQQGTCPAKVCRYQVRLQRRLRAFRPRCGMP